MDTFIAIRMIIMGMITKKFSDSDNQVLHILSSNEEIEKVVLGFPKGKSPRGDGVTYNFLQGCWDFVGECYKGIVHVFWTDARLSSNSINGIVKMTPKCNDALEFLDN